MGGPDPTYPARLDGRLDGPVSRLLWLVKWALLVPHFVCLTGLWVAMSVLTVVAGFAILFTARYPRAIFDFNVGVLRWTWRPQYLVVPILAGGSGAGADGVIALLALAGAVVLALTGSYWRELFDVTMGFNRWRFRVLAYVALLRDEYLLFRYDGGATDPGTPPSEPGELPLAA